MDTNIFAVVLTILIRKALGHAEGRRGRRKKLHLCKRKEKGGGGGMDSFTLFKGVGLAVGIFFSGLVFILQATSSPDSKDHTCSEVRYTVIYLYGTSFLVNE